MPLITQRTISCRTATEAETRPVRAAPRNPKQEDETMTARTAKKAEAKDFAKAGVEQFEAAVKSGQESAEKALKAGKENVDKAYQVGADALSENVDKFYAAAREQYARVWPTMAPKIDEVAEWNKGNLDALFAASEIAKKGAETMAGELAAFNQAALADAAAKDLISVKSYPELVQKQTESVRSAFDRVVAESTKISEMSASLASEVSEPLQARWAKVSEAFRPAA
ncbi:MAG: phasin family protein [Rhodospirillaceae bacterium]|nr:phasin family protein [Rhodospirillaceae bacterium]